MAVNNATLQNAGQLQGTYIRQNGQITQQPVTPAGQAAIGANPDQTKMAGTPAQKTPVIQEATQPVQPPKTGPQQLGAPQQAQQQQKQQTAQSLSGLSNFNDRVQTLVETKFNQLQTGNVNALPAVAIKQLNDVFDTNKQLVNPDGTQVSAQDLLSQYAANPKNEQPLVQLSAALKTQGANVTAADIKTWYDTGSRAVGLTAAQSMADNVLVSDFADADFQKLGIAGGVNEVAQSLDLPAQTVQSMTMSELEDAIKTKIDKSYSDVANLQAKLAQVPPGSTAAQQLQQQIVNLTGAGAATTDTRMQELAHQVNDLDTVHIGGHEYQVKDFLADNNISQLIQAYLDAPDDKTRNDIFPPNKFADLRLWIGRNQELLQAAGQQMADTAQKFDTAQQTFKSYVTGLGTDFVNKVADSMGLKIPANGQLTSDQLDALTQKLNQNGAISLAGATPEDLGLSPADKEGLLAAVKERYDQVKDMSKDQILDAWKASQELNHRAELKVLLGLDQAPEFLTDPAMIQKVKDFGTLADRVEQLKPTTREQLNRSDEALDMIRHGTLNWQLVNAIGDLTTNSGQALLSQPEILRMIQDGKLTSDNAQQTVPLLSHALDVFHTVASQRQALNDANSTDDMVRALLHDSSSSLGQLQDNYQENQHLAQLGDAGAQQRLQTFDAIDVAEPKGQITDADIQQLAGQVKGIDSLDSAVASGDQALNALEQLSTSHGTLVKPPEAESSAVAFYRDLQKQGKDSWSMSYDDAHHLMELPDYDSLPESVRQGLLFENQAAWQQYKEKQLQDKADAFQPAGATEYQVNTPTVAPPKPVKDQAKELYDKYTDIAGGAPVYAAKQAAKKLGILK